MVQVPAGATVVPAQLSVSVKAEVPVATLLIVSDSVPVFLTVTGCAELEVVRSCPVNVRLVGLKVITGTVLLPVPVSATIIGCFVVSALSMIVNVAEYDATAAGVNVAPTVQFAPAASDVVHVPAATAKSVGFVPPGAVGSVSVMADVVLFVSVTNCAAVGVPTSCVPKLMLVGITEIVGVSGKSAT